MHGYYILGGVSILILLIVKWYQSGEENRRIKKEEKIKKKEKWGEYLPANAQNCFGIARWTSEPAPKEKRQYWSGFEDSRVLLEQLGFRILGIADQMLYMVEPPSGWTVIPHKHHLYSYVVDQDGNKKLLYFRKNDIMNMNDYRAWISENVDN